MSDSTAVTQTGNLPVHYAAAACYLPVMSIGFIASIAFLVMEPKENTEIRFHAVQSLLYQAVFIGGTILGSVVLTMLQVIGVIVISMISDSLVGLFSLLMMLVWLVFTLLVMVGAAGLLGLTVLAAMEKSPRVPVLAGQAAKFSGYTL